MLIGYIMSNRREISGARQQLRELVGRLAANVEGVLAQRGPVVKGLFQLNGLRCGQANCKCSRGQLHPTAMLVVPEKGKRRNIYVPVVDRPEIQRRSQRYRKLRQARAEIVKLNAEILKLTDLILELLSEEYVPELRRKRSSGEKKTKKQQR